MMFILKKQLRINFKDNNYNAGIYTGCFRRQFTVANFFVCGRRLVI